MDNQNNNGYPYNGEPYNTSGQESYTGQSYTGRLYTNPENSLPSEPVSADVTYHASYVPPQPPEGPQASKKEARREKKGPLKSGAIVTLCIVCAVAAGLIGAGVMFLVGGGRGESESVEIATTAQPVAAVSDSSSSAGKETASYIYELATQQVVGVTTEITYYNVFGQYSAAVVGSGVIISEDGYILTNYHVIEDAYEGGYQVKVLLYDETEYEAEIIGFEEDNDVALLKIDATGLNAAELGDSDDITVGQVVYTVGNPLGELDYTMTSGIVSAMNRTINTSSNVAVNMFQIDAAVNSGNSGGPVYNTSGQVIGIVTAKYSSTGVEGLGFAIPISDAVDIVNDLINYGYVTGKASLGITVNTVTSSVAQYYNMVEGAYVYAVAEDSAAEIAGIQEGDIITAIDDTEVLSSSDLTVAIKAYHAGDSAELTIWRGQEEISLTVIFDEQLPSTEEPEPSADPEQNQYNNDNNNYYGDWEDFFGMFGW